jgi:biopolymer transport protein TolQ
VPAQSAFGGDITDLIVNAGPLAKGVLALLALLSVVSWALIVEKWWEFRKITRESNRFLRVFREARRFSMVYSAAKKHRESPLGQLYGAGAQEVAAAMGGAEAADRAFEESDEGVGAECLENMARAMRRAAAAEVARMERYLPFLATTASAAPFIGLFGTVWGVMSAFHGIGTQGSASLAVVAPGISEALIATAAGLAAAIPAVIGYNFFVNRVKHWAVEMEGFSLDLLNLFARPAARATRVGRDGH